MKNLAIIMFYIFLLSFRVGAIVEVAEGVFAGESVVTAGGAHIYFALEKIDEKNLGIWKNYKKSASLVNSDLLKPINIKLPEFSPDLEQKTGLSEQEYEEMLGVMKNNNKSLKQAFAGTWSGIVGDILDARGNLYIAYASKKPVIGRFIPGKHIIDINKTNLKKHNDAYENIIMSVDVKDEPDSPFMRHRGIFRNPMNFVEVKQSYTGISLMLHGFAAAVAQNIFARKKYMWVNPTIAMSNILKKNVTAGSMFIGSNLNYEKEDLEKFPPILFYEQECPPYYLLKEGVDVFKGQPAEGDIQQILQELPSVDGLDGHTHLINISALAKFFTP